MIGRPDLWQSGADLRFARNPPEQLGEESVEFAGCNTDNTYLARLTLETLTELAVQLLRPVLVKAH